MYELTLYKLDDTAFRDELLYALKDAIKINNVIVASGSVDGYDTVCIGTNQDNNRYLKTIILNEISKNTAIYYKKRFLFDNVHIGINKYSYNKLINSLVILDIETDIKIISEKLNMIIDDRQIYIDSLFSFRLKELYDRWKDISRIVCENIIFMLNEKSVEEIIAEFISSSKHTSKQIRLIIKKDIIMFAKEECQRLLSFENNISGQEELLCKIITFYPEKILLDGDKNEIEKIKQKLTNVFRDKVIIIS